MLVLRAGNLCLIVGSALLLIGCSYQYVDRHGVRHVIGLVNMAIAPATECTPLAGEVVSVTTVGVGVTRTQQETGLVVGYHRSRSASIRDDVIVNGNPLQVIDVPMSELKKETPGGPKPDCSPR